jgi:hypothetical protein
VCNLVRLEAYIAGEQFIGAVTAEGNRHALASGAAKKPSRQQRRICNAGKSDPNTDVGRSACQPPISRS